MLKAKNVLAVLLSAMATIPLSSCHLIEYIGNRTYTIRFHANGGEGSMEDFLVEKGDERAIPGCAFTKEGYECLAWSTEPEGKNLYGSLSKLTVGLPLTVKNGDTVDLYAVWTTPGFTFEVSGIGFLYSAYIDSYDGNAKDVIVPSFTRGHYSSPSVVGSGPVHGVYRGVFAGHTEIETVTGLPTNKIADELFYGCTSLRSVDLKSDTGIASVGARAFYNCALLEELELYRTAPVTIGEEAFYGCTSIEKLVVHGKIEGTVGRAAFYGWTAAQTIEFEGYSENVFGEDWLIGCSANILWTGQPDKSSGDEKAQK